MTTIPTIICDLDGTLCNIRHREHYAQQKNWDAFHALMKLDRPVPAIARLIKDLIPHYPVLFLTGRPERYREQTEAWLFQHLCLDGDYDLAMRPDGDMRPDVVYKRSVYDRKFQSPEDVYFVLEDRDRVVAMWRALGLTCLQPRLGGY